MTARVGRAGLGGTAVGLSCSPCRGWCRSESQVACAPDRIVLHWTASPGRLSRVQRLMVSRDVPKLLQPKRLSCTTLTRVATQSCRPGHRCRCGHGPRLLLRVAVARSRPDEWC